jgi:SAM-dependent methyltransferase
MSVAGALHGRYVVGRRVEILSRHLAELLPHGAKTLDVGCGDGAIDRRLMDRRPDLAIDGLDVLVRPSTHVPVREFDGRALPAETDGYDAVTLVDVLHHAADPRQLLAEAARVARLAVVVKDHFREGFLAGPVLRLMDWFGNAHHGVDLRYDYWTEAEWRQAFRDAGLAPTELRRRLGLYAWPARLLFERRLHFVVRLEPDRRP